MWSVDLHSVCKHVGTLGDYIPSATTVPKKLFPEGIQYNYMHGYQNRSQWHCLWMVLVSALGKQEVCRSMFWSKIK